MLDTEILAQLMQVPKDLPCNATEHFRSPYWVNMVEAKPNTNTNTTEAFRVALFGEFDLLHYLFDRSIATFLVTRRKKPDDAGVLYYGPAPRKYPPEMEKYNEAFLRRVMRLAEIRRRYYLAHEKDGPLGRIPVLE
ncbi:hypothetical protein LZL87_004651 [Fusarium oxysporum]|nr:hypothetical protein LZL87_004651 [Fusarium oxysporum]